MKKIIYHPTYIYDPILGARMILVKIVLPETR